MDVWDPHVVRKSEPIESFYSPRPTLTYQNLLFLWFINPHIDFVGTLQKSRFWRVKEDPQSRGPASALCRDALKPMHRVMGIGEP